MNQPHSSTRLRFEPLEARQPLAGDVDVFAIGNVLHVRGDDADNGLAIHSTSEGVIEVTGLNQGGAATTVNGLASQPFIRIKEIVLTLGDGNDALVVTSLPLSGTFAIQTGVGNDIIGLGEFTNNGLFDAAVNSLLGGVAINTNLIIETGEGNDTIVGGNISTKAFVIATGIGNDTIDFDDQGNPGDVNYVPGVTATAGLAIDAGEGNNGVSLEGLNVSSLRVLGGAGIDTVTVEDSTIAKGASIQVEDGANVVTIDTVTSKSLAVSVGLGNDMVTLDEVTCGKRISLTDTYGNDVYELDEINAKSLGMSLGFGNDQVSLDDVTTTKSIGIDGGDGNDTVDLKEIIAKSLAVVLGDGDDALTMENVAAAKKVIVAGGLGNDTPELKLVSAAALDVLLAAGDDEVTLDTVLISTRTKIDGGKDANTYTDSGNNTLTALEKLNFPTIV